MTDSVYVVLHIPKTGGQTLHRTFKRNFGKDAWLPMYPGKMNLPGAVWETDRINEYVRQRATRRTRCLFGHLAYFGVHNLVSAESEARYITFMRDPIERCLSQYFYRQAQVRSGQRGALRASSLVDWLQSTSVSNRQLRQLLAEPHGDALTKRALTREDLEEGKRRLRNFWFVGLTETFEEDSRYLYGELCFRRFPREEAVNVTPAKGEVSSELRQKVSDRNELDLELYAFAQERRAEIIG